MTIHPRTGIGSVLAIALLACLPATSQATSNQQVFAFAEAQYAALFAGTATAGQYEQYSYRHYSGSGNYLAIDTGGTVYLLGPASGGALLAVTSVAALSGAISSWEATLQPTTAPTTNYSGTWAGSYQGMSLSYVITQNGNQLTIRSIPTLLTAEQTYTGVLNGQTAEVSTTDYANATTVLTAIDANTVEVVQGACTAPPAAAIYCLVPTGTALRFTRQ